MNPVIIHADGTDCAHTGAPRSALGSPGGPACAGGQQVTHVRFNGKTLTIGEAAQEFAKLAEAFTEGVRPVIAAWNEFGRQISRALAPPAIRQAGLPGLGIDDDTEALQVLLAARRTPPPGTYRVSRPITFGTATPLSTDQVIADIDAALEDWEDGEDAAEWHADGGPDELAELAEDDDECAGMLGARPSLVIFDEVRCWDAEDGS